MRHQCSYRSKFSIQGRYLSKCLQKKVPLGTTLNFCGNEKGETVVVSKHKIMKVYSGHEYKAPSILYLGTSG
jgi:hypothetical protein